jgi:hypothetical protein
VPPRRRTSRWSTTAPASTPVEHPGTSGGSSRPAEEFHAPAERDRVVVPAAGGSCRRSRGRPHGHRRPSARAAAGDRPHEQSPVAYPMVDGSHRPRPGRLRPPRGQHLPVLALRLGARTGGARGRLHAWRPLSSVQGQGGSGPGGARVGQPDLVARGRWAGRATARSGGCAARAGPRSRRLLPARRRPRHHGAQGRVQRSGPPSWARDQACFKNAGQALRQPDRRGAQRRVGSTRPAGQRGCAGVLGSARGRRDRARWASTARRATGRPRGRGRARAGQSPSTPHPTIRSAAARRAGSRR